MKKIFLNGFAVLYVCTQTSLCLSQIELPDLGNPSDIYMSKMDEPAIGRTYFRSMRKQGHVVEVPLFSH
jgi:predicted Zn-dependent protease